MDRATVSNPDYAGAVAYALNRLHTELPPELIYHNPMHTEGDVLPAAVRLARLSNLAEPDLHLLEVAAAFHDLGQIRTVLWHELIGAEIMSDVLPRFGFSPEEIERVTGMILATELPQTPLTEEQALLCDADLDSLGREDFFATSKALWQERGACGIDIPWQTWLETQFRFVKDHQYFTPAARALRDEGKRRNIEFLERLICGETVQEISFD
ncbi:MAG: HD domain-containing protein [Pseudohongiella sp.]|nr:HD domain-containing protein [Pseudohongiella sp.]